MYFRETLIFGKFLPQDGLDIERPSIVSANISFVYGQKDKTYENINSVSNTLRNRDRFYYLVEPCITG